MLDIKGAVVEWTKRVGTPSTYIPTKKTILHMDSDCERLFGHIAN